MKDIREIERLIVETERELPFDIEQGKKGPAAVNVTVQNDLEVDTDAEITCTILNGGGQVLASSTEGISITAMSQRTAGSQLEISNPELWSLENPALYLAEIFPDDLTYLKIGEASRTHAPIPGNRSRLVFPGVCE